MGNVISSIAQSVDAVAKDIGQLVTDVSATVTQLSNITSGFVNVRQVLHAPNSALLTMQPVSVTFATAATVDDVLADTMDAAMTASRDLYTAVFDATIPSGSDNGVVDSYKAGGDPSKIVPAIKNDFTNWGLPVSDENIKQMAETIKQNVTAKMGASGTSWGIFSLNRNQKVLWTVAYGLFAVTQTSQGLVYAFTGGLKTKF